MPKGIIVLGMHRSGTSLITRLLNLSGCIVGDDEILMKPDPVFNPKGYWERTDLVELNDRILYSIGCSWWKVAKLDISRISPFDRDLYRKEFLNIINSFPADKPYVIKDPRMILTWPMWHDLLPEVYFVVLHREPVEIALSLNSRNKIPTVFGLALWEYYIALYGLFLEKQKFSLINYGSLITNPLYFIEILFHELELAGIQLSLDEETVKNTIDLELYRHKALDYYNSLYTTDHLRNLSSAFNNKDTTTIIELTSGVRTNEILDVLTIYEEYVNKYKPS